MENIQQLSDRHKNSRRKRDAPLELDGPLNSKRSRLAPHHNGSSASHQHMYASVPMDWQGECRLDLDPVNITDAHLIAPTRNDVND